MQCQVGAGSFGDCFKALNMSTGKNVVIKKISATDATKIKKME